MQSVCRPPDSLGGMSSAPDIPWRGPGPGRPDLPLPPGPMPLRRHGQTRKRWRYVAVFAAEAMVCAARAQVGPFTQSFWMLWDRHRGERFANTSIRPGSREVRMRGPNVEIDAKSVSARLEIGESPPVESICPSGSGWGWTRKRAGMPVRGTIEAAGRRIAIEGRGVDDESAGYHRRHTSWLWSAGVGRAVDGRALAWNLVEGINDPPERSERAVWIDGDPHEPAPVAFQGIEAIQFADGSLLSFGEECERVRRENLVLLRSDYRLRFGTFSGGLDGVEVAEGLGVMEQHDALW